MPLTHYLPSTGTALRGDGHSTHTHLLLYTEMRYLSKGRPLARVFELCEPFQRFLLEKQSSLAAHFSDKEWVVIFAYLCDVFNLLNKLNLSFQGRMTTVFKLADNVVSFKARGCLWGQRVNTAIFDMFQTLVDLMFTN